MTRQEIFYLLKKAIEEILPEINLEEITLEDSLKEIGANSSDRAEIIYMTMEEVHVKLPMVTFNNAKNIGEIVEYIFKKVS